MNESGIKLSVLKGEDGSKATLKDVFEYTNVGIFKLDISPECFPRTAKIGK